MARRSIPLKLIIWGGVKFWLWKAGPEASECQGHSALECYGDGTVVDVVNRAEANEVDWRRRMTTARAVPEHSAGDPLPAKCAVIRVHVTELRQLFNSIDPSPFRSRDLDPKAEEFIVGWAKDFGRAQHLALVVSIDRAAGLPEEAAVLRDAIHEFFRQRALGQRLRLRELLRVGRTSLAIGLLVLASAVAIGNFLASVMKGGEVGQILREMLVVGGWVSMWRPLEIFLYDWWPIREEARLSDRLASMPVRIEYLNAVGPEAWKRDWPAVSQSGERVGAASPP